MDLCTLDWSAIAGFTNALITLGIAAFAYRTWHLQKAKEVIARECRTFWTSLNELQVIYTKLDNDSEHNSENQNYFLKK